MSSLNMVQVIGNLGRDPETHYTASGVAITNVSVAATDKWKSDGETKEHTEWFRIVFFDKLAEIASEYLKKGAKVYVGGKLRTRKWTDKDGNDRYTTEVIGDKLVMLGGREQGDEPRQSAERPATKPASAPTNMADMEDDIPF